MNFSFLLNDVKGKENKKNRRKRSNTLISYLLNFRFIKQRLRYLLKSQSSSVESERNISHLKKHFDAENEVPKEERNNSSYDAAVETTLPAFTSNLNSVTYYS